MGYMIKERSLRKTINVVYNVSLSLSIRFHTRDYYVFRKFFKNDIRKIQVILNHLFLSHSPLQKAGLSPSIEQLISLSNYLPNLKLHDLLVCNHVTIM